MKNNNLSNLEKEVSIDYYPTIDSLKKLILADNEASHNKFFLIDMRVSSNRKRFFVVDLGQEKIIDSGLVAQGVNSKKNEQGFTRFSNEINSNCTSLGRYKIGKKYVGKFGKSYKLHGLEKTNSNAYLRAIVLHSYSKVPDMEQSVPICYSLGCPMVSKRYFSVLESIIDRERKPLILSIVH